MVLNCLISEEERIMSVTLAWAAKTPATAASLAGDKSDTQGPLPLSMVLLHMCKCAAARLDVPWLHP